MLHAVVVECKQSDNPEHDKFHLKGHLFFMLLKGFLLLRVKEAYESNEVPVNESVNYHSCYSECTVEVGKSWFILVNDLLLIKVFSHVEVQASRVEDN